jgi:glutathione reductase (NADPH)
MDVASSFDLLVVGTGAAASAVATKCRAAGWRVAVADARPYGGTCALRGCEPKRVLIGAAEIVDAARALAGKGVAGEPRIRWPELMQFKRSFTDPMPSAREHELAESGITTLHGVARFIDHGHVEVGDDIVEATRVHIAAGATPAELSIDGAEYLTTSDEFLELRELPRRIVFVGGGYISFEFAHLARTAGAEVSLIEVGHRPMPSFDDELVELLVARTRAMGIGVHMGMNVEGIEPETGGLLVRATRDGLPFAFEADLVVHGAGRVPATDGLALERADVAFDREGIIVNACMQSVSNPLVYAAGDVVKSGPALTPVAALQARIAASNLLDDRRKIEYPAIPSAVFTLPPLASVGIQPSDADEERRPLDVRSGRTASWMSSRRIGQEYSAFKIVLERDSGRIVGAHLFGHRADELVNVFAIAIEARMLRHELADMLFAFPTASSDIAAMLA